MGSPRKSLKLLPHEKAALEALYVEFNIPTDQYPHRPGDLETLVRSWNDICDRSENSSDVLHYMITRRKKKQWVTLGRENCERLQGIAAGLTDEELHHLDAIHEELQVASDNFALNSELSEKLKKEFAKRTGRIYPGMLLAATMIRRRKAGALATLKPQKCDSAAPFADIDQVASN